MEKEIIYTAHLRFRLKIREIPDDIPKQIYKKAKEKYFDSKTGYYVAVGKLYYKNRFREMVLVYEETASEIRIITIHPLKPYEKLSKIKSKRWQKNE